MPKLDPSKRIELLEKAKALAILHHDCQEALKTLAPLLTENPMDVDALILRGNILDLGEEYEESKKCYDTVLRMNPNNTRGLIDMADWYSHKGDVNKASDYYDRALTLLKNNNYYLCREEELKEAYLGKILLLREVGDLDQAQATEAEAQSTCPGFGT